MSIVEWDWHEVLKAPIMGNWRYRQSCWCNRRRSSRWLHPLQLMLRRLSCSRQDNALRKSLTSQGYTRAIFISILCQRSIPSDPKPSLSLTYFLWFRSVVFLTSTRAFPSITPFKPQIRTMVSPIPSSASSTTAPCPFPSSVKSLILLIPTPRSLIHIASL
jgi:hypothetical protein